MVQGLPWRTLLGKLLLYPLEMVNMVKTLTPSRMLITMEKVGASMMSW